MRHPHPHAVSQQLAPDTVGGLIPHGLEINCKYLCVVKKKVGFNKLQCRNSGITGAERTQLSRPLGSVPVAFKVALIWMIIVEQLNEIQSVTRN